jgi:hypothetical protein
MSFTNLGGDLGGKLGGCKVGRKVGGNYLKSALNIKIGSADLRVHYRFYKFGTSDNQFGGRPPNPLYTL